MGQAVVDDLPIPELPGLLSLLGPWQQRLPWFLLHQRLSSFSCQRCLLSCPGLPLHKDDLPRQPWDEVGERNSWVLQFSLITLSFKCADLKTRVSIINLYFYLIFELISPTSFLRRLSKCRFSDKYINCVEETVPHYFGNNLKKMFYLLLLVRHAKY